MKHAKHHGNFDLPMPLYNVPRPEIFLQYVLVYTQLKGLLSFFSHDQFMSGQNSINHAISLVPAVGGIFLSCPQTQADLLENLGLVLLRKKIIKMLFTGLGRYSVLSVLSLGPYSRPWAQFFPIWTSRPANNRIVFLSTPIFEALRCELV